ncbi:VTT domain-containing protein [Acuticoccus sp. M5D2P5]|uniref:VTT domain-containing protein n=1 Tax=Acuticoccus kalidii TaxID=2910977 RepID=UPI001F2D903F|nr:VTT domain-containing protein [Acuticoccus kalidii]MCF3933748.1 VTT domain-containing protein [Acuticoccus kalidii]
MFEFFRHPLEIATSRLSEVALLFAMPFVREEVAIVTGSLLVVEHRMPSWLALVSLYAGIVASDCLLFGLGRLARRSGRVRHLVARPGIERLGAFLRAHTVPAMIVSRLLPGLMSPVYIGCGLSGVRFAFFAAISFTTAAIYLLVFFWLATRFGDGVLSRIGYWSWIVAILLLVVSLGWLRTPPWGVLLRVGRSGIGGLVARGRATFGDTVSHGGMPPLRARVASIATAERIPTLMFYAPLAVQWIWLSLRFRSASLPTIANPRIEVGGLWGESKTAYLDMVSGDARHWLAPYASLTRRLEGDAAEDGQRAVDLAHAAGLAFPLVAKPDIGWQGYGVRRIDDAEALRAYVAAFPEEATLMVQALVDWDGEAGVFYARRPGAPTSIVLSLTLRYFPHVVGDGTRPVRDLILEDRRASWKAGAHFGLQGAHGGLPRETLDRVPARGEVVRLAFIGSIRVGGHYRDASDHITPALTARFDAISRAMPDFYYGRYDIRFASLERLEAAEDFRIIEINGAGAEAINVWDPGTPLRRVYARLFAHQRLLFEIGAANRARGWRPAGPLAIARAARHQNRLVGRYPPSS